MELAVEVTPTGSFWPDVPSSDKHFTDSDNSHNFRCELRGWLSARQTYQTRARSKARGSPPSTPGRLTTQV